MNHKAHYVKSFLTKWYFLTAVSFVSPLAHTQISLVASSGTTGPSSYTTLKSAFDAVNAGTHIGVITITISANTTETSSAILRRSGTGSSSYSSVLVKPATGTSPDILCATANPVIILDGASNITIDGANAAGGTTKDLTISNSNQGPTSNAIVLLNGASGNTLKNAVIQSAVTSTATIVLSNSTTASGNNNNIIENNDITSSATAVPFAGILNIGTATSPNNGNIYRNNRIFEFSFFGFADGDGTGNIGFSNNTLVEGNEFYNLASRATPLVAIFIRHETGISNMTISKNKIHSLTTSASDVFGILLYDAVSVTVINNMISLSNSPSDLIGIGQETALGATIKIYYNTIYITGTTTDKNSFALFKNWFSINDDIRDNIFVNTRLNNSGTRGQYAFVKLATGTFTSNYNDLVSTGNANNYVGHVNTGSNPVYYVTLADWQAGTLQDANSISKHPVFVSATDLHLDLAGNCRIDNKGISITGITDDFDGNLRSITTPDMGADEFTGQILPTMIVTQPSNVTTCFQQTVTFNVVANGSGTLSYQWRKNGNDIPGAVTNSYTLTNIMAGNEGNYSVKVTGACDSVISNNATLTLSGPCTALPAIDRGVDSMVLKPNPVVNSTIFSVYTTGYMKINWRIVDVNGRFVKLFEKQVNRGRNDIQMNLAGLAAGSYYLLAQTPGGKVRVLRLIKL